MKRKKPDAVKPAGNDRGIKLSDTRLPKVKLNHPIRSNKSSPKPDKFRDADVQTVRLRKKGKENFKRRYRKDGKTQEEQNADHSKLPTERSSGKPSGPLSTKRSAPPLVTLERSDLQGLSIADLKRKLGKSMIKILNDLAENRWYDIDVQTPDSNSDDAITRTFSTHDEAVLYLKKEGEYSSSILTSYVSRLSSGDSGWLQSLAMKGTSADRISALTLLVQQCPLGRVELIRAIAKIAAKPSRREASIACEALKDLFINDLLPTDRKLNFFKDNPLLSQLLIAGAKNSSSVVYRYRQSDLVLIWFEDFLKSVYAGFVLVLSNGSKDPLKFFKRSSIKFASELLSSAPEQERGLLTIIVSKLMDVVAKDSDMAFLVLRQLLTDHPPMKPVVGKHVVDAVLGRLATDPKAASALHRPVLFLSELQYSRVESNFAKFIVESLLQIFHFLINRIDESDGSKKKVNAKQIQKKKIKRRLTKGKVTHWTPDSTKTTKEVEAEIDPNSRLFRAVLNGLTRAMPYVGADNLPDMTDDWVALDRLIQKVGSPTVKISILNVLHRLSLITQKDTTGLFKLIYNEIRQFNILHASSRKVLLNMIREMVELDHDLNRPLSIFRRLNQVALHTDMPSLQLILMAELIKTISKHAAWGVATVTQSDATLLADVGEEVCKDVPLDDDQNVIPQIDTTSTPDPSIHRGYNPRGGDPKYARPDLSHLWEMELQSCSICPSVSSYASALRNWATNTSKNKNCPPVLQTVIPFEKNKEGVQTNPLDDVISSSAVLDLLAYRSHQKIDKNSKTSNDSTALATSDSNSINSAEYWRKKRRILPHESFLAAYFQDEFIQRKMQRAEGEDMEDMDIQDLGIGKEEEEIDRFLDGVLAKEMGTEGLIDDEDDEDDDDDNDDNDNDVVDDVGSDFGESFPMDDDENKEKQTMDVFASAEDYQHMLN